MFYKYMLLSRVFLIYLEYIKSKALSQNEGKKALSSFESVFLFLFFE